MILDHLRHRDVAPAQSTGLSAVPIFWPYGVRFQERRNGEALEHQEAARRRMTAGTTTRPTMACRPSGFSSILTAVSCGK